MVRLTMNLQRPREVETTPTRAAGGAPSARNACSAREYMRELKIQFMYSIYFATNVMIPIRTLTRIAKIGEENDQNDHRMMKTANSDCAQRTLKISNTNANTLLKVPSAG